MISRTLELLNSNRVRNVSESLILPMSTTETLLQILAVLGEMVPHKDQVDLYTDTAERLSKIASKSPAWGWRYVQSVSKGTVEPSKKFSHAVEVLAISLDGVPVVRADSSQVKVFARNGTIPEDAFIVGKAQRCANPSCTVMFVPNTPLRKYCSLCNPKKGD